MKLAVTGLNHTTAPVEVRERLAFDPARLTEVAAELRRIPGLNENVILSTCNRVEIAVTAEDSLDVRGMLEEFLSGYHRVSRDWLRPFLYYLADRDAIRHIYRVAASLDSMVVGEPQILGQLKDAYEIAKSAGSVNGFLDSVLTSAFRVAKRVRSETEIGQSAVSVSYAAVELARQIFGSLAGHKVMLVGAGKMSELAARHLIRAGVAEILVTNRSPERARQMSEVFQGRVIDYTGFVDALPDVDVVITSSGAPHYILHNGDMQRVLAARRNRPMFLIDIAVPRNIDPAVNELDNIFLYDIDDLQKVVESNRKVRESEAELAERIIGEEIARLEARLRQRGAAPLIVGLQQQLESIRRAELDRARNKLGSLTPQQMEAVDAVTRGLINKIAHGPIAELRRLSADNESQDAIEALRRAFRLDSGETDE
jgi:glutamyl-tRNA reductase